MADSAAIPRPTGVEKEPRYYHTAAFRAYGAGVFANLRGCGIKVCEFCRLFVREEIT
jgi:hypothetical protein